METDKLYEQRKMAIHLLRSGLSKPEVATRLHHSREWVYTWWKRYNKNKNFADLRNYSSAPKHKPNKFSEQMRQEIIIARSELEAEKAESKTKVHIGVDGIRERLKTKGLKKIPCARSIERILKESSIRQTRKAESKPVSTKSSKVDTNLQHRSEKNVHTNQANSRKQNSSWVLKLIQGKIDLVI
ncbi:MAG: helix-turn-helix domain-containing protein [Chloroflexi bacterium]|nr:helix-turn-helix domain-containing protein [Chloroflexota bacterium]